MKRILSLLFLSLFLAGTDAFANDLLLQSIQQNMADLQKTVQALQAAVQNQNEVLLQQAIEIKALKEHGLPSSDRSIASPQTAAGPTSAVVPAQAPSLFGFSQGFNPEIGVVGIVQAKLTEESADAEGNDTITLQELELNFGHYVDPYSRFDAVIAFNDALEAQNVEIEEGYYSHWGLPFGFRGQIGKFRPKIGKQNLLHGEFLDTVDYPIVIRDFFGEEGLASSGARLVHNIPNPLEIPLEITGEVLRGNNGNSFSGVSRRPIFNTHLKSFFEPTKDTNLELGWTTMFGDENIPIDDGTGTGTLARPGRGQDRYGVKVYGADATFNWFLPEGKTAKFQNEFYFQNRSTLVHPNDNPWGFYSLVDYRFSRKFSMGVRFDYLEPLDVAGEHIRTTAISPYLTFWQSEFANFRLQFTHTDPAGADAKSDNAIFLKANVLIGVDKHPVQ
ncbi:MAG: hypothetical protein HYZ84_02945 [Candidatus Omnitrophica bacterium]|nr:hypothetical protein [Candidatus Omnitrophota bacterium]